MVRHDYIAVVRQKGYIRTGRAIVAACRATAPRRRRAAGPAVARELVVPPVARSPVRRAPVVNAAYKAVEHRGRHRAAIRPIARVRIGYVAAVVRAGGARVDGVICRRTSLHRPPVGGRGALAQRRRTPRALSRRHTIAKPPHESVGTRPRFSVTLCALGEAANVRSKTGPIEAVRQPRIPGGACEIANVVDGPHRRTKSDESERLQTGRRRTTATTTLDTAAKRGVLAQTDGAGPRTRGTERRIGPVPGSHRSPALLRTAAAPAAARAPPIAATVDESKALGAGVRRKRSGPGAHRRHVHILVRRMPPPNHELDQVDNHLPAPSVARTH